MSYEKRIAEAKLIGEIFSIAKEMVMHFLKA